MEDFKNAIGVGTRGQLVSRDDFAAAGLSQLGFLLEFLSESGWSFTATVCDNLLELLLTDLSVRGEAEAFEFWRVVKACTKSPIAMIVVHTHGMNDRRTFISSERNI